MRINLNPKNSTVAISNKTFVVGKKESKENFIQVLESEVRKSPTQARKLLREVSKTRTMLGSILLLSPAIPPELTSSFLIAIAILAALGVGIAIVSLMLAGLWKMSGFGKARSDEWTKDIYKGLLQVLTAPIIVALVVAVCVLLFHNLPAFSPISDPIQTFFHHKS